VAAEWRWHNEWFHNCIIAINYTGDEMKGLRWVGHMARMEERRNTYGVLEGKITGTRQL